MRLNPVTLAWQVMALIGIVGAITFIGFIAIGPVIVLVVPVGMAIIGANATRARRHQTAMVLAYLNQAMQRNLPLPQMMQAAAAGERLSMRRSLIHLAHGLGGGLTLSDALERSIGYIPRRWVGMLTAGERIGQLQPILAYVADQAHQRLRPRRAGQSLPLAAVALEMLLLGLFITAIIAGASVLSAPQMQEIAADFDMELPLATAILADTPWLPFIYLAAGLAIIWISLAFSGLDVALFGRTRGERSTDYPQRAIERITGGWWGRDRALADACLVIAMALEAGLPMTSAVREAAALRSSTLVRQRLLRWARAIEAGQAICDAARAAHMPQPVVSLLGPAHASGNMAQAFHFLHRHYAHRYSRFVAVVSGAAGPLMILIAGAVICWLALALLLPLAALMEAALDTIGSY